VKKKEHLIVLFALFVSFYCKAQKVDSLIAQADSISLLSRPYFTLESYQPESRYNARGAATDIESKKIRILFSGGFGGMPDFKNEKDKRFQKKYKVEFYSQGCLRYGINDDEEGYNKTIFKYLDSKYGKSWRKEIRKDAIGFE
jgi:hypothetical protein